MDGKPRRPHVRGAIEDRFCSLRNKLRLRATPLLKIEDISKYHADSDDVADTLFQPSLLLSMGKAESRWIRRAVCSFRNYRYVTTVDERLGVARCGLAGEASSGSFAGGKLLAVDAINDARAYMTAKKLIDAGRSPSPLTVADGVFL